MPSVGLMPQQQYSFSCPTWNLNDPEIKSYVSYFVSYLLKCVILSACVRACMEQCECKIVLFKPASG